jgi:hypothetical protein
MTFHMADKHGILIGEEFSNMIWQHRQDGGGTFDVHPGAVLWVVTFAEGHFTPTGIPIFVPNDDASWELHQGHRQIQNVPIFTSDCGAHIGYIDARFVCHDGNRWSLEYLTIEYRFSESDVACIKSFRKYAAALDRKRVTSDLLHQAQKTGREAFLRVHSAFGRLKHYNARETEQEAFERVDAAFESMKNEMASAGAFLEDAMNEEAKSDCMVAESREAFWSPARN